MNFRHTVSESDRIPLKELVQSTGFFYDFEADVAVSLIDDTLAEGEETTYRWIMAEDVGRLYGFACFGLNPVSTHSFDLYWIVVHKDFSGKGLGTEILRETEKRVKNYGGKYLWAETSGRPLYDPTRAFYEKKNYSKAAVLHEFYGPDDSKVIYVKAV